MRCCVGAVMAGGRCGACRGASVPLGCQSTPQTPFNPQILSQLMAGGVPVAFLAGMGGMYWRLHHAWRTALKFANADPAARPRSIHTFFDDFDVEVAARIGRVFDAEGAPADPAALDVTEAVLRAGVAMFPASPYLHIVYSNFLIEVWRSDGQLNDANTCLLIHCLLPSGAGCWRS